jgi:hypothetical protein
MPLIQRQPEPATAAAAVHLRLLRPEDVDAFEDEAPEVAATPAVTRRGFLCTAAAVVAGAAASTAIAPAPAEAGLSPTMRLSEFFERYYVPTVMQRRNRSSDETISLYRDSINWWVKLTGDPPLNEIDDVVLYDRFAAGLREAKYRRGRVGALIPLSQSTCVKHMKHVRAVYFRTGPKRADPKRPSSGILAETEHLVIQQATDTSVKPPITAAQAPLIFAACDGMACYGTGSERLGVRRGDGGPAGPDRWRSLVATFYYSGFRFETVQGLRWRMLEVIDGRPYWKAPPEICKGKRKGVVKYIHPHAYQLLQALPRSGDDELVYPFLSAHSHTHLLDRHEALQKMAGLAETNDFHGYKRGFVDQQFALGLTPALRNAQLAAAHEDSETTRKHYVEIEPKMIDLFVPLDAEWASRARPSKAEGPNQLSLF